MSAANLNASQLMLEIATHGCQRWRGGRARYRPKGEVFDTSRGTVELIDEADAKRFVCTHHYAGSYVAARLRVGLFVKRPFSAEALSGCAVFSVSMSQAVLPAYFPDLGNAYAVELGRFVLLDDVEAMAESWFLARAFRKLHEARPDLRGVLAFCDPVERRSANGELQKRGHTGIVYGATNARLAGRSSPRSQFVCPSGHVLSPRALSKLRNAEQGAAYVEEQLRRRGAPARRPGESGESYVDRISRDGTLRVERHPGNVAFTWRLDHRGRARGFDRPPRRHIMDRIDREVSL